MDSQIKSPIVYEYIDLLAYLQAYYQFRKARNKNFSYEYWSQELEFNSRSFLRMIVSGKKKPSAKFIDAFSRLNFATKNEENYFNCLVKYSQAATAKDRQLYSKKMLELIKHEHGAQILKESPDSISDPLLPRLLSLLCFSDLQATAERCARIMKVNQEEVRQALQHLEQLELVEKIQINNDVVWLALSDVFHVADNKGNLNLLNFHKKSLADAIAAFHQPKKLRRYKSLLVPMSEEDLEKFNLELESFISEQLLKYNSKNCLDKYLYQVNFNFHPISEKMDSAAIG